MFKEYTILLVEDNLDMQEYMLQLLEDQCKKIYCAENGEEGLRTYKRYQPDLIITDLNMPIMNGISMSKEIKKENPFQPIILLTAYGEVEELQEAINTGLNAFISKPIENIETLFSTITKLLNTLEYTNKLNIPYENQDKESVKMRLNSLFEDILHDDMEYFDYESLKKKIH